MVCSFANYSVSTFCAELRRINWSSVYLAPNVDIALKNFRFLFLSAVDRIAPFRRIRICKDTQPWMTSEILGLIVVSSVLEAVNFDGASASASIL